MMHFDRAGAERFRFQPRELFFLPDVSAERDDLRLIILLEPAKNDRRIEPARIRENDFHLIAKGDIDVARGLNHFAIRRDKAQTIHRVGDRHMAHLVILVADHRAELSFVDQLHRLDAEARAEDPVERGRRAAALEMPKDRAARFLSGARGDLARDYAADAAVFDLRLRRCGASRPGHRAVAPLRRRPRSRKDDRDPRALG